MRGAHPNLTLDHPLLRIRQGLIAIAALLMLLALPACAIGPGEAVHSFGFGGYGENQNIEILNYRYGDSKVPGTHADEGYLSTGHIPQAWLMSGVLPVGNSLYVKWHDKSTNKVYEDTVDLKSRLPWNMNNKDIHFLIRGPQLFVYLIEGEDSKQLHPHSAPDCPAAMFAMFKCTELYPEHWANF